MDQLERWFNRVPIIKEEEILLRPLLIRDLSQLEELYQDPELYQFLGRGMEDYEKDPSLLFNRWVYDARQMNIIRWGIVTRKDSNLVGEIMFYQIQKNQTKIGCRIRKTEQGKGYASKATKLLCSYALEAGIFDTIQADVMVGNEASEHALLKSGFEKIGNYQYYKIDYVIFQYRGL
ncbi:GNAT family acetyltransferase Bsu1853 (YoaA) [Lachnospiraceae bacterium KM106-2]|nr:GNAT family acetyltransferase Bsu1853 (YoaA) [Lachnospiraceae bacterium KM106-2]